MGKKLSIDDILPYLLKYIVIENLLLFIQDQDAHFAIFGGSLGASYLPKDRPTIS